MPYGDFKDLIRWTTSDQILLDKTFNIAKNGKYDGYQRGLTSMIYKIFDKKSSGGIVKKGNITTKELAKKLQKTINKKIEKTMLGVLSLLICNYKANLIMEFVFCYMLLTFIANMYMGYSFKR